MSLPTPLLSTATQRLAIRLPRRPCLDQGGIWPARLTIAVALALATVLDDRPACSQGCIDTSAFVSAVANAPLPYAYRIALNGSFAYLTGWLYGRSISVVDVSNPLAPAYVNTVGMSYSIDLSVAGNFVYATDAVLGLRVLDLSAPALPVIVGASSGNYSDIVASGGYAYVTFASGSSTWFRIFDISTPTSPQVIASLSGTAPLNTIALKSPYIYAGTNNGLLIIDVSNPFAPSVVRSFASLGPVRSMSLVGDRAYFGENGGLAIYDITDELAPIALGYVQTFSSVEEVVVSGSLAYVTCPSLGLRIVDVSDPAAPRIVEGADLPGARGIVLAGNDLAFVASGSAGLQVVDVSQPSPPAFGRVETPGTATGVALLDGVAVVADGGSGLQLVDTSDPDVPSLVASFAVPGSAIAVDIAGRTAYVAGAEAGLHLVDLSSPTTPNLLGSYDTAGLAYGVQVAGRYAYIADVTRGLTIVDVDDARHPVLAGSVDTPGNTFDVALAGSRVFVADGPSGLLEIDASNPSAPVVQDGLALTEDAWGLDVAGSYAYVATGFGGLDVVRIDPLPFTLVSSKAVAGFAHDVTVLGNTLYLSASEDGVRVYDLSNPANPVAIGQIFAARAAVSVAASGTRLHIADGDYGLALAPAHCSNPTSVELSVQSTAGPLLWAFPNPSYGATSVSFNMPHATDVRLAVFDIAGRHVRDILQGRRGSGRHDFLWDGRNDAGLLQPAGVYMLRLESPDRTVVRRIVRLR